MEPHSNQNKILLFMLSFLQMEDIHSISQTCRSWSIIVRNDEIVSSHLFPKLTVKWRNAFRSRFPKSSQDVPFGRTSWRIACNTCVHLGKWNAHQKSSEVTISGNVASSRDFHMWGNVQLGDGYI